MESREDTKYVLSPWQSICICEGVEVWDCLL